MKKSKFSKLLIAFSLFLSALFGSVDAKNAFASDYVKVLFDLTSVENNSSVEGFDKNAPREVTYATADTELGNPFGLYSTGDTFTKAYFAGWSKSPNWRSSADGEIYLVSQKISDVFASSTETQTLYPVYIGRTVVGNVTAVYNKADINNNISAEQTIDSTVVEGGNFVNNAEKNATYAIDESKTAYKLKLNSTFQYDTPLAYLTYVWTGGIFTNSTYRSSFTDFLYLNGIKPNERGTGGTATHIDLTVSIDEKVTFDNELNLAFKSWQYKPAYILDENYNLISDVTTSRVSNGNVTTFTVDSSAIPVSNGKRTFKVRVHLRSTSGADNVTLKEPLELYSTDENDFTVSQAVAKTGEEFVVSGHIDGLAVAASMGFGVPKIPAPTLTFKFAEVPIEDKAYIGIDQAGKVATKTDDGKAIFYLGLKHNNDFHNLVYRVYSDAAKTTEVTKDTAVNWTIEPIAQFENVPSVIAAAPQTLEYNSQSTFIAGQTNTNKASAIKSGVYKVTATLANGESDYAYLVVPGDVNRNGEIETGDISQLSLYYRTGDINRLRIVDEFTLILADMDRNGEISTRDATILSQMYRGTMITN